MNSSSPNHHGLVALQVAEDAAVEVIALMRGLPAAMRTYQDQAVRASASAVLNLAEGTGRRGRDRRRFWQVAHASTKEAMSAVRIAVRVQAVDQQTGQRVLALLDRLGALTYGLWQLRVWSSTTRSVSVSASQPADRPGRASAHPLPSPLPAPGADTADRHGLRRRRRDARHPKSPNTRD